MELELYNDYFDPDESNRPYPNSSAHLTDVFCLLDMCLNYVCAAKGTKNGEERIGVELLRTPRFAVSSEELVDALTANTIKERQKSAPPQVTRQLTRAIEHIDSRVQASVKAGFSPLFERVCRLFRLSDLERFLFMMAASVACERRYEAVYSFLNGDANQLLPTKGLAERMVSLFFPCDEKSVGRLTQGQGNLFRYLLEPDTKSSGKSLMAERLMLTHRAAGYLRGINLMDTELENYASLFNSSHELAPVVIRQDTLATIDSYFQQRLSSAETTSNVLNLYGPQGIGRRFLAEHAAKRHHVNLIYVHVNKLVTLPLAELIRMLDKVYVEVLLTGAVPCFNHTGNEETTDGESKVHAADVRPEAVAEYIAKEFTFCVWISDEKEDLISRYAINLLRVELAPLTIGERIALWNSYKTQFPVEDTFDAVLCANKYILTPKAIRHVLHTAQALALSEGREKLCTEDIHRGIGQNTVNQLGQHATRINAVFHWEDLVVDADQKRQMQMICNQVRYRNVVGEEWGFHRKTPYGRGLCALFYGSPGTGKTMAVQVMANELGMDLYRIDLSQMVSKYIGETQKNIATLFRKAKDINAVLFFDEADAFFSKRSEVKDSNDKYANADTAFLLQKLEDYEGITILATNYVNNIDDAFKRRIKFMINFVFPTPDVRLSLWKKILPSDTRLDEDIDFEFFAENFELSGSNIKEILTNAAYLAASEHGGLKNRHIVEAVRLNFSKYGKILTTEDFGYLAQ